MKRNLKALGLALVATLAMSAVAASGASAQVQDHFRSDAGPLGTTHLTAETLTPQVFQVTTGDDKEIICNEVDVHGTIEGEEFTKVTVEPTYEDCGIFDPASTEKLANMVLDTNGCHFEFTSLTDAEGHAETTIQCPENVPGITITVSAFNVPCVHVKGDQEVGGVSYHNGVTPGGIEDITVTATVHGIKSTTTHNAFVCPTPTGKTETHDTGTYFGDVTVTGFEDSAHEVPTDIWVESTVF